jgi:excisionase family DNA binding protein
VNGRLVDAAEVAEQLGVPKTWVLESARSKAIPSVKLGRYVRFDLDDVEQWLSTCKTGGRSIAFRKPRGAAPL